MRYVIRGRAADRGARGTAEPTTCDERPKPMSSKFVALAAVALIGVGSVASARADVLFDNITQFQPNVAGGIAGYDPLLNGTSSNSGGGPIAVSFSTGSQGLDLSSVTFALTGVSTSLGSLSVDLMTDSTSTPNSPSSTGVNIGTILDSQLSGTVSLITVKPSTAVILASNQRYWIELSSASAANPTSAEWGYDKAGSGGVGVSGQYGWSNYGGAPASGLDFKFWCRSVPGDRRARAVRFDRPGNGVGRVNGRPTQEPRSPGLTSGLG